MIFPFNVKAQEVKKIEYQTYKGQVAFNTPGVPNIEAWDAQVKRESQKARLVKNPVGYWERQCVYYAKQLTGVYGTWGNGGRYLSDNSDPVVGAVLIFRYTHVGVITAVNGTTITYSDRNFDLRGTIRQGVTIDANDPSIWKIHKF